MEKKLIYISSPYTGDINRNVRRQHYIASRIFKWGHLPYMPLLLHFQDLYSSIPYETCMEHCLRMVRHCDGMIVSGQISSGVEREIEEARRLQIPIVYGLPALRKQILNKPFPSPQ